LNQEGEHFYEQPQSARNQAHNLNGLVSPARKPIPKPRTKVKKQPINVNHIHAGSFVPANHTQMDRDSLEPSVSYETSDSDSFEKLGSKDRVQVVTLTGDT